MLLSNQKRYYNENDKLGGIDPYSGSKAIAELFLKIIINLIFTKTFHVYCRAGNVIGGGDWTVDRIIPDLFKSISSKKK